MNWAYHHQVSSGLEVFTNINWALYLPPTLQIGYIQQLENYRLCFFGAVQPQHFGFYIDKKQIKQLNVFCEILFGIDPNQINILHTTVGGVRKSFELTTPKNSTQFNF